MSWCEHEDKGEPVAEPEAGGGNTSTPPARDPRGRAWIFTINNYDADLLQKFETYCKRDCKSYTFQEEEGGENHTPHIQGALYFKSQRSFSALKKQWPTAHIEKARSWKDIEQYCQKAETRIGPIRTNERKVKDPMEGLTPRPFQTWIENLMKEVPDERTIYWIYDPDGKTGKTTMAKSLCIRYKGQVLYLSGKVADVKNGIYRSMASCKELKMAIFNFPRTMEGRVSYEAFENVKDGIFFNTKFECDMCIFDCPHVVVLSNWQPDRTKLSRDRWCIIEIDQNGDFKYGAPEDLSEFLE